MSQASSLFNGSFEFKWLPDPQNRHRNMQLLSDVSFTDSSGHVWTVPKDAVIDGASIPWWLWTYTGSPFVGNYRRASVVHDYFCDTSSSGGNDIHKMFKEAMIADGVGFIEARAKYYAVLAYGNTPLGKCGKKVPPLDTYLREFNDEEFLLFDEAQAFFQHIQTEVNFGELSVADDPGQFRDFAEQISKIARIRAPSTYRTAVEHRLDPNLGTLDAFEMALREEMPDDQEFQQAILLAIATVPEPQL